MYVQSVSIHVHIKMDEWEVFNSVKLALCDASIFFPEDYKYVTAMFFCLFVFKAFSLV